MNAVTVVAPWTRPLTHLGLEIVVLTCCAATLAHALRARRQGDLVPLFTWATIFIYGLAMEILSYNFVKNFTHAQFSVMFYDRQLPLYVTALYPVLLYTGITTARRLRLGWAAQAVAAGLLIVAMDFPFDLLGPVVGWWSWSDTDPNIAVRWQGVPVTSYYWHLGFGGVLAALTARLGPRVRTPWRLGLALPVAFLTIALGLVTFAPFHALSAMGVAHGSLVAGALALGSLVLVLGRPQPLPGAERDRLLLAIPVLFYGFHLGVALRYAEPARLSVIVAVTAFAALVNRVAHRPR